ncbi:unnamed protein product [Amoebophrya sp. A25]|nr:unnamed protein product [Amoebophrya sp. A25]|eukprot:GSA25T00002552001.1
MWWSFTVKCGTYRWIPQSKICTEMTAYVSFKWQGISIYIPIRPLLGRRHILHYVRRNLSMLERKSVFFVVRCMETIKVRIDNLSARNYEPENKSVGEQDYW